MKKCLKQDDNLFERKKHKFIFNTADIEVLSCTSQFLHQKDLKDSNQSFLFAKKWLVALKSSPCVTPRKRKNKLDWTESHIYPVSEWSNYENSKQSIKGW